MLEELVIILRQVKHYEIVYQLSEVDVIEESEFIISNIGKFVKGAKTFEILL